MPLALVVIKTLNYQWEEFRIFLLHVKLWFDKATMLMRIAQGWAAEQRSLAERSGFRQWRE